MSIPTTNEAAQALVKMAMNGHAEPTGYDGVQRGMPEQEDRGNEEMADSPYPVQSTGNLSGEDFPEGAEIFGGPEGIGDGPMDEQDLEPPPVNVIEEKTQQQIFKKVQRTGQAAAARLGLRRNPADRSGVPSMGIARVDEKGNPILPPPPDYTMDDDEEDPGEQI
jgi:hypothetical protein